MPNNAEAAQARAVPNLRIKEEQREGFDKSAMEALLEVHDAGCERSKGGAS